MRIYVLWTIVACTFILATKTSGAKPSESSDSSNSKGKSADEAIDDAWEKAAAEAKAEGRSVGPKEQATPKTDKKLCQGDMIFSEQLEAAVPCNGNSTGRRRKRGAVKWNFLWQNDSIPFKLPDGISAQEEKSFLTAVEHWNEITCLNFVRIDDSYTGDDYVNVTIKEDGCYASVAFAGPRPKILNLQRYLCWSVRLISHELGHIAGLFHEQSREDRDAYVEIISKNVDPAQKENFAIQDTAVLNNRGLEYDYTSVMHYSQSAFAKVKGKITIKTIDEKYQNIIGRTYRASFLDYKVINMMYNCTKRWKCPEMTCPGQGFVGKGCVCFCPGQMMNITIPCDETTSSSTTTAGTTTTTTTTTSTPTTTTTTQPVTCENTWTDNECDGQKSKCAKSRRVQQNCQLTCNQCVGQLSISNNDNSLLHDEPEDDENDWPTDLSSLWPHEDDRSDEPDWF